VLNFFFFLFLLPAFSAYSAEPNLAVLPPVFQALEKRYGIIIYFRQLEKAVPEYWLKPPTSFKYKPLAEADLDFFYLPIQAALAQYPDSMIKNNLRAIGLAHTLSFFNTEYGATYSETQPKRNSIYLAKTEQLDKADAFDYLLDSVHHEFSSILLKKYNFPEQAWRDANPSGFKYLYEDKQNPGLEALQRSDVYLTGKEHYERGFLSEYALASLEEDFNVYSGEIFTHPEAILKKAKIYPRIAKKVRIWLGFYISIDIKFMQMPLFKQYAKAGLRPLL
jgi:hypothetical protein